MNEKKVVEKIKNEKELSPQTINQVIDMANTFEKKDVILRDRLKYLLIDKLSSLSAGFNEKQIMEFVSYLLSLNDRKKEHIKDVVTLEDNLFIIKENNIFCDIDEFLDDYYPITNLIDLEAEQESIYSYISAEELFYYQLQEIVDNINELNEKEILKISNNNIEYVDDNIRIFMDKPISKYNNNDLFKLIIINSEGNVNSVEIKKDRKKFNILRRTNSESLLEESDVCKNLKIKYENLKNRTYCFGMPSEFIEEVKFMNIRESKFNTIKLLTAYGNIFRNDTNYKIVHNPLEEKYINESEEVRDVQRLKYMLVEKLTEEGYGYEKSLVTVKGIFSEITTYKNRVLNAVKGQGYFPQLSLEKSINRKLEQ